MAVSRSGRDSVFLSHASEDKDAIARPLAEELRKRGLDVWFDEFSLVLGSSLRREIDKGLALARFGVVVLSASFFEKEWPQRELDALTAREVGGVSDMILPIWHEIDRATVARYSPMLADRKAVRSNLGIEAIADHIVTAIERSSFHDRARRLDATSRETRRPERPRFEWHPEVHAGWGQSALYFLRIGFGPTFRRRVVLEAMLGALDKLGVRSWSLDELLGGYDALLRLWVPRQVAIVDLISQIRNDLSPMDIDYATVEEILRSWVWQSDDGPGLRYPLPGVMMRGMSPEEIRALEAGRMGSDRFDELARENLIAPIGSSPGLRFYVALRLYSTESASRRRFVEAISDIVDDAVGIDEPALYRCSGFADFLVTGKAGDGQLARLKSDLIEPLNTLPKELESRSSTLVAAGDSVIHADSLPDFGSLGR